MTRRVLWAWVLIVALVLAGCGGKKGEPAAGPSGQPAQKVTIRLATWAHAEEAKELQAILDKINAQAQGWQIVHEPVPSDYYTKLQTTLAGDSAPDLFWLAQEYVIPYAAKGVLLDLCPTCSRTTGPPPGWTATSRPSWTRCGTRAACTACRGSRSP